ncbi:hypothetical protein GCM10027578_43690 [Spirosoma luteolum]
MVYESPRARYETADWGALGLVIITELVMTGWRQARSNKISRNGDKNEKRIANIKANGCINEPTRPLDVRQWPG